MDSVSNGKNIRELLDDARKELLDLGLRNSLINFRYSRRRSISVIQEHSEEIYNILVTKAKSMAFKAALQNGTKPPIRKIGSSRKYQDPITDSWLQTNLEEDDLQGRLLGIYHAARTHIEERGFNVLYLALGMLEWYESDESDNELKAPLILLPVALERTSAREKFTIKYNEDEIEENLSLSAKLKAAFGIVLPSLPELDEFDIISYFADMKKAIRGQIRWKVRPNEIALGFFSFGKLLMFRDLDHSIWPENASPADHSIIKAILRDGFREPDAKCGDDESVDSNIKPVECFQMVDADSSQIQVILDVKSGRNLVVQGPPGTGKSQTITNIISEAVAAGKKVLFVAEKMAALEVVKRRLDQVGLGDACLELHSHNAHKKTILEELYRTARLGKPRISEEAGRLEQFTQIRDQLNDYCKSLNTEIGKSGYTPFQVIGELLKTRVQLNGFELPLVDINLQDLIKRLKELSRKNDKMAWDRSVLAAWEIQLRNMENHLSNMGLPSEHPFRECQLMAILPIEKDSLKANLANALNSTKTIHKVTIELSAFMGIEIILTRESAAVLVRAAVRALEAPHLEGVRLSTGEWQEKRDGIASLIASGSRYEAIHREFDNHLIPEAWEQDILATRQTLVLYEKKWWRLFSKIYRKARNTIAGLQRSNPIKKYSQVMAMANAILEEHRQKRIIDENSEFAGKLFGVQWQGLNSDWKVLEQLSIWIIALYREIGDGSLPIGIVDFLSGNPSLEILKSKINAVERELPEHKRLLDQLMEQLEISQVDNSREIIDSDFSQQEERLEGMHSALDTIHDQIRFNALLAEFEETGIGWIAKVAQNWEHACSHLVALFRHVWFGEVLRAVFEERNILTKLTGDRHELIVREFRELDQMLLKLNRARVALIHFDGLPKHIGEGQMGVLLREFEKKSRHLPIRRLMEKAGNVIQSIKPVFMMSPMSVASFLSPDCVTFDLVVFDEASQVKPVDAFGAILRGKQVVVVGDSKQLPPTSFFDTIADDPDASDEDDSMADMESILGAMAGRGAPQRMLRWHYRSRHESLIATSNKEFYNNRLVVFPSPASTKSDIGLIFHHLPDAIYDRGVTRTNKREAEMVARAVMKHAEESPHLTLGVATFNIQQMQAIIDQLELLRNEDDSCEEFFSDHPHEPFFVKNLESVQGDERDVIFISVGFGRTREGIVFNNFGALNATGGERRLNVLITRARRRCEVFSNLTHGDIDLSKTQSRGVAALQAFLKYAQTGILDTPFDSGRGPDSLFEEMVAEAIAGLGHEIKSQVGSGGFYIDLAVVDPNNPGRYLLGIECDGASYHNSRSARDRDRLRQQVLEGLGWRIHRIWSTDWYSNPDRELKKVAEAIETAKAHGSCGSPEGRAHPRPSSKKLKPEIQRDQQKPLKELNHAASKYKAIRLPALRYQGWDLHQWPDEFLAPYIEAVVNTESPIHWDIVRIRIAEAASVSRIGSRIRESLDQSIRYTIRKGLIRARGEFLWKIDMEIPSVRDRSDFPSFSRKIELVPPEEIERAILNVVGVSYGIDRGGVGQPTCDLIGFGRVTEGIRDHIDGIVDKMIEKGILFESVNILKIRQT